MTQERQQTLLIGLAIVLMPVVILLAAVQLFTLLGDSVVACAWTSSGPAWLDQAALFRELMGG